MAKAAKIKYLGVAMMCGSDQGKYDKLVYELQNYFTKGNYYYPVGMTDSYKLLINYKIVHSDPETSLLD